MALRLCCGTTERLAAQAVREWGDALRLKDGGEGGERESKSKSKWKSGEGIFLAPFASRVLKMLKYHSACSVKSLSPFLLLPHPSCHSSARGRGRVVE